RSHRRRRSPRCRASAASNATSSPSIPKPRTWSSPSHSSLRLSTTALISTPGCSSKPGGSAADARISRYPARLSWSVIASTRTPASNACRTRSAGSRTPSDRRVWVWRSIVDGAGGITGSDGSVAWREALDVNEALDPFDLEGKAGGRIDVDLAGVEDHRPVADLEPRRQRVDEPRQDRLRVEPDDAPDRPRHPQVGLVRGPARQDPLVAG